MEALTACVVRGGAGGSLLPFPFHPRRGSVGGRPGLLPVLRASSKDGPKFDKWDLMELKFGRLLGEDPKLTLAKILARKSNPDVSYLEVEKSFRKNKGKLDDYMINIPADLRVEELPSVLSEKVDASNQKDSQNVAKEGKIDLSRPPMNTGTRAMRLSEKPTLIQTQTNQDSQNVTKEGKIDLSCPTMNRGTRAMRPSEKPILIQTPPNQKDSQNVTEEGEIDLSRPTMNRGTRAMRHSEKPTLIQTQPKQILGDAVDKGRAPNISLRKPFIPQDDDIEMNSKLKFKPNLFLKMRKNTSENLSNLPLLKKPEIVKITMDPEQDSMSSRDSFQLSLAEMKVPDDNVMILNDGKMLLNNTDLNRTVANSDELQLTSLDASSSASIPVENDVIEGHLDDNDGGISNSSKLDDGLVAGLQPPNQSAAEAYVAGASSTHLDHDSANSISMQAALLGKPQRLDSSIKGISHPLSGEKVALQHDDHVSTAVTGTAISADQEETEESDWKNIEHLLHSGKKAEVELISCSSRGFVVSFGSLIGFLLYHNLGTKWKFLAFESWLRKKGLDPSLYRQNLTILGRYDVNSKHLSLESAVPQEANQNNEVLPPKVKFEDLLESYDQEKVKFLSSFIGQRLRVSVILADRNSRRIMFSGRPQEKKELVEKKRGLMARLSIGDIMKCCIKKITYFGIIVEVEDVPALIHQSELPWEVTLDPSSFYKVGQIVEAKVHQLDYTLERFTLSLRDVTPDPSMEALESVGDRASLGGRLEPTQTDIEWADVESLIKELQNVDGVSSVSKGCFFISHGLVPTFQVYMTSMFDNKYKLLARYENKVQEVIVESSLDKEQMKAAILTCTSRVT